MLAELHVRNYALIEDLTVAFGPGLNVLTGETGAGKSVILGALSLVLGERPDTDMIRTGSDTAQVEARFENMTNLAGVLDRLGIEPSEDALILRRRTERSGRGAVHANDAGITVAALAALGDRLVDLHGQHQHQLLLKSEVHLDILDEYAGLRTERRTFGELFIACERSRAELARLEAELAERRSRRDLTEFQLRELSELHVEVGETERLHAERELLQTAERRFALVRQLEELLSEQEGSVSELLAGADKALSELASLDPALAGQKDGLTQVKVVVDELWRELVRYREAVDFSPARLDELNSRLFAIEKLERKYGKKADELPAYESQLRAELEGIELDSTRHDELTQDIARKEKELGAAADALSRKRSRARKRLEDALADEFSGLGLEKARLSVAMAHSLSMAETGSDLVEFLFSANAGEELRPLRKVASGGELSRIMLGLKSALARADPVPTMVFDEIDVGIGGRVAEAVGRKLAHLGQSHQVICITHLPQIARYADTHFQVTKSTRSGRTVTSIRRLDQNERVEELARMGAGASITSTGLAHAREMLESSAKARRDKPSR